MVTRYDYTADAVKAAKSVLIELTHLLGEYRDDIVLVGGWVPELLLPQSPIPHVGSIDIDLALNHRTIGKGYEQIEELLKGRGYFQEKGKPPFMFFRNVPLEERIIKVRVDLLTGEDGGTGRGHRHQEIQNIKARKARGCDLAFGLAEVVRVDGELPGGGQNSVQVRVTPLFAFLAMKGMALHDRLKEKDAWDIYYCTLVYPGGIEKLAELIRPHTKKELVIEGFGKIAKHFSAVESIGPRFVADFEGAEGGERERIMRDAFERVNTLIKKLS